MGKKATFREPKSKFPGKMIKARVAKVVNKVFFCRKKVQWLQIKQEKLSIEKYNILNLIYYTNYVNSILSFLF